MTDRRTLLILSIVVFAFYAPLFAFSVQTNLAHDDEILINDVGRLNPTYVKAIVKGHEVEELQETIARAKEQNLPVSIAGKRHSMGGHAFYKDGVVLDMTEFNQILSLDLVNKTITLQSGATWRDVIEAANPHDLAVEVMQAYNSFTIGGSLSVNVHESDPNFGPLVKSVRSFHLLLANGTILDVSRIHNPELFSLVLGGYGLFGVILDATIQLTDNAVLLREEKVIQDTDYLSTFRVARNGTQVGQIFARLSIATGDTLLRELVVTTYKVSSQALDDETRPLQPPSVALKKFVFGLSRMFDWGKGLRWYLQKGQSGLVDAPIVSRNNLMNGDAGFLDYTSATDTDILQEYFIPVDRLTDFLDDLRGVVRREGLNLLSATIRYIPVNTESVLSYSANESFGVVLYFNVGTSASAQETVGAWSRELIDDALRQGGTYYLPYVLYATPEQFRLAYPRADEFFAAKARYDPDTRFRSAFYDAYANP